MSGTQAAADDDGEWEVAPNQSPLLGLPPEAIDRRTGAPAAWRAQVGSHRRPEQRLAAMRRLAPDAIPYGDDNFLFTHPRTGRPTLYNDEGRLPSWGDLASLAPEAGEVLGGGLGAAAGAMAGAPTGPGALASTAAGAGLGATIGRELAERGVRYLGGTPDSRSAGQQVQDAATTLGVNAAAPVVMRGAGALARGAFGAVPRAALGNRRAAGVVDDYARAGVPVDAASVTGNRSTGALQRTASLFPGGAAVNQGLVERQAAAMGQGVEDVAARHAQDAARLAGRGAAPVPAEAGVTPGVVPSPRLSQRLVRQREVADAQTPNVAATGLSGVPGRQEAGAVVEEGAQRAMARMNGRVAALEREATRLVGDTTPVTMASTAALRAEVERELAGAPASRARVLQPVLDRINALEEDAGMAGGLTYRNLRRVRTDIGRVIGDPRNPASSVPSDTAVYLERLYGALTSDLEAAARAAGPEALRAFRTATRYNRLNRTLNTPSLERVLSRNTDEDVFKLLLPQGGRPNIQAAERVLRNLEPGERRAVTAAILDRLGRPTPGARVGEDTFSPATFLTNWTKLTENPRARRVLFGDEANRPLAEALDRLIRVGQRLKDHGRTTNWSNTAFGALTGEAALGTLGRAVTGDMYGAVAFALGPVAGSWLAMKAMTNPRFVNWLAGVAPQVARQRSLSRQMVDQLGRVAVANPELRDIWERYRDAVPTPFNGNPGERRERPGSQARDAR